MHDIYVDSFWIGPEKSASTWVYHCLAEHPQVCVPAQHRVHYFDILYNEWDFDRYLRQFSNSDQTDVRCDTTPSYLRSAKAAERITHHFPHSKIMMCLRNPIDRAFSHYWHEKKKQKISFQFEELFDNYDLFRIWIETGFYYEHIQRYRAYFPDDHMLILLYDDLLKDEEEFIRRVYHFLNVDSSFRPSVLKRRVNAAGPIRDGRYKLARLALNGMKSVARRLGVTGPAARVRTSRYYEKFSDILFDKSEFEAGMKPETRKRLLKIFEPENRKLAELIGRDLSSWR